MVCFEIEIAVSFPGSFLVQNRSHYVTSTTSSQFRHLDSWLASHAAALRALLVAPGLFTLFGEWLYARHSVAYSALPDYFLAFDLLHVPSGRFLSRVDFHCRLTQSTILPVRSICCQAFSSVEEMVQLLETRSQYADGFVEGVYVRVDETAQAPGLPFAHVAYQGKIVRPDFIQNIEEHWSSRVMERNALARDCFE
jgi:atypical dual specificity phosphatase